MAKKNPYKKADKAVIKFLSSTGTKKVKKSKPVSAATKKMVASVDKKGAKAVVKRITPSGRITKTITKRKK